MIGNSDHSQKAPAGIGDEIADMVSRRGLLPSLLRTYGRLIVLAAAAIWGINFGTVFAGYNQLSCTRLLAEGPHRSGITSIAVAATGYPKPWLVPPPQLARKLVNAINGPRLRSRDCTLPDSYLILVKYSDGFIVAIPVCPDHGRLFIFDYDPLNFNFDWEMTSQTFVSPLQPLTPRELKWLRAATKHPTAAWVKSGGHG